MFKVVLHLITSTIDKDFNPKMTVLNSSSALKSIYQGGPVGSAAEGQEGPLH